MRYYHQTKRHGSLTAIHHFREAETESGMIVVKDLGHTVALAGDTVERPTFSIGLFAPTPLDIKNVERNRYDRSTTGEITDVPVDQEACETLDDFIEQGVERWRELISTVGGVSLIEVHAMEVRNIEEATHGNTGLILPAETTSSFDRYVASSDELEAMEQIADGATALIPDSSEASLPGLYL